MSDSPKQSPRGGPVPTARTAPRDVRKSFSLVGAALGLLVGAALVTGIGMGLWYARTVPHRNPKPIDFTVESLPATLLGWPREDIEFGQLDTPDGDRRVALLSEVAAAQKPMFDATYGGEGIRVYYGVLQGGTGSVTAVNGDFSLPPATSPAQVDHAKALVLGDRLDVPGTPTTRCLYSVVDTTHMTPGQSAEQLITTVSNSLPAQGYYGVVSCLRRDPLRNLTVEITSHGGQGNNTRTPTQLAREVALATDEVWKSLD